MDFTEPYSDDSALREIILERIQSKGPLGFDEFMRLALYHPAHGYYFACEPALDYQSSPNVHPVFGAAIARQVAEFWRLLDRPRPFDIFEAGAGNLSLALALLEALRLAEPELYEVVRYTVQDLTFTDEAVTRLLESAGAPATKLTVAQNLPEAPVIEGCILSNELLDALPFRRIRKRDGRLYELNVGLNGGHFVDVEVDASSEVHAYFEALSLAPAEGCEAEVNLESRDWLVRAVQSLRRGYILTLDYGYEAAELYAPWRKRGTLLTFYRHASGDDPYVRVGRQDITASVDFTTIRESGERAGLCTYGLTTQAELLGALGISEALRRRPAVDAIEAFYALRRSLIELINPTGLGRIRALVQGKETPPATPRGLQSQT